MSEPNFFWRDGGRAFHYHLSNDVVVSVTWTPYARRGDYPLNIDEMLGWTDIRLIRGEAPDCGTHKTLDQMLEVLRTEAEDSVEIAAFRLGAEGYEWFHPDDWGDDVRGWQTAEDVREFIAWCLAQEPINKNVNLRNKGDAEC